ncbi:MAG: T9SS type A sorting domain-containing protein, partial [Ignavibacteriae bacterium]|nr:T9SS type A sorting domain-containing protein [Ignavibacteriota bacterium]
AIATLAPSGLVYSTQQDRVFQGLFENLASNPRNSLGKAILVIKQILGPDEQARKYTLLGDPALVLKNSIVTGVRPPQEIPTDFVLHQNYPNPFNPETNISFDLPKNSFVTLKVFNLIGQEMATIANGNLTAGQYSYKVGKEQLGLSSGVYFYRLQTDGFTSTKKMVLVR